MQNLWGPSARISPMSLGIDIDKITGVMIGNATDFTPVAEGTFHLDGYEYIQTAHPDDDNPKILFSDATGFAFETAQGAWVLGPVSSIRAVRTVNPPQREFSKEYMDQLFKERGMTPPA